MKTPIEIRESYWQDSMKAMEELLEKVAQEIAKNERLPIIKARAIAARCLAVTIERLKMDNPIPRANDWCLCGANRRPMTVTNGTNEDRICGRCNRHMMV